MADRCPVQAPGYCTACDRKVRWAEVQTCPRRYEGGKRMSAPCTCTGPGYCTRYAREMNQADWDICRGAVDWLKADHVKRWMKESGATCVYDAGPLLDEQGVPVKKRGCGCNGQPPVISLKACTNPQMVAARTPGQDGCEHRCAFFTAKPPVNAETPT